MHRSAFARLAVAALALAPLHAASAAIWYVDNDAPGGGTGTSWTSPFNTISAALSAAAASGDEIRIATGTYAPAPSGGPRASSFTVNKSVTIRGGYCGFGAFSPDGLCGTSRLTGDLNGDDGANFANNGENSLRVVNITSGVTVRLERFIISGGNANGGIVTGGGLGVASGCTVTCANLRFENNHANNWGGAIDHNGTPTSTYKYCDFLNNRAGQYGGAVSLSSGNGARMGMCRFAGNTVTAATAGSGGGAIWINGPSSIINCVFSVNSVTVTSGVGGGAIASGFSNNVQITNCTFAYNFVTGVFNPDYAFAIAAYAGAPGPVVTNCLFYDDNYILGDREIEGVTQTTYCLNSGETGTGNTNLSVYFVDDNGYDNVYGTLDDELAVTTAYGYAPGVDIANAAALPADIMDLDSDGNTAEPWPDVFYAGNSSFDRRAQHGITPDGPAAGSPPLDIGAYETRGSSDVPGPIIHVDPDGIPNLGYAQPSGASWDTALLSLADAFALANTFPSVVNEIRIGSGIFKQDVYANVNRPGLTVRGGYAGRYSPSPDVRDPDAFPTIFEADFNGNDPPYFSDLSNPAYSDNRGFNISTNGNASPLTIESIRVRGVVQGNVLFDTSDVNITLRDIHVTRSYLGGGALLVYPSLTAVATMTDCVFENILYDICGVVWLRTGATLRAANCRFTDLRMEPLGNTFPEGPGRLGGAIWHENSANSTLVNCLFNNCEAAHGPVIHADNAASSITLRNCTLVNNRARYSGGAIYQLGGLPQISNSILWGNTAPAYPQMFFTGSPGSTTFQYSIIQGGVSQGTSIVNADPQFIDANGPDNIPGNADDDFRLKIASPAVDLGSVAALPLDTNDLDRDLNTSETLPFDLDFLPRNVDMDFDNTPEPDAGAYESFSSAVLNITANTTHATIAEAINASTAGNTIIAPGAQFTAEPNIDFLNKPVTLGFYTNITQPTGGRYTLTDGATLGRPTSTLGPSISLTGELRVPANASAFVNASNITNNLALNVFDGASLAAGVPGLISGGGALRLYPNATLSTSGALTSSGTLNALPGSTLATIGSLTLSGTSTLQSAGVIAGPATINAVTNWTNSTISASTLTINAAARFTGSGSVYATTSNFGRIYTVGNTLFVGNLTNNTGGIITVQLGTATLIGSLTNNGTINGVLSNPPLPPEDADPETVAFYRELASTDRTAQGDGLFIRGDYTTGPAASLSLPNAVWRLTVAGNYDAAINNSANYDMRLAELVLTKPDATSTATLEAMSLDRGNTEAGLNRNLTASFPIGTLRITPGAAASTTDNHDNALNGFATCEAVYTENLIIEPGATLTATTCRVYYRNLTNLGTITTPQNVIAIPPPCGGADFNNDHIVDTADLVFFIGRFGQPSTPGSQAARADFNNNGIVDTPDLVYFIGRFGSTCP